MDPVFFDRESDAWWFANYNWSRLYGPYPTELDAREQLTSYRERIEETEFKVDDPTDIK